MKFKIYTLGCKVNSYESNIMAEALVKDGYTEGENPDICIINTCTVTNTANSKSLKMIKRIIRENEDALIIVTGCMSQVNNVDIEGVDIVIGSTGKSKIVDYIKSYDGKKIEDIRDVMHSNFEEMELDNFDKTRAFVKIQDGCNNYCSYCIIPYTRGHVKSKARESVLREVNNLVSNGHKEIVLTGIHTGHYNDSGYNFYNLLTDLVKIEDLKRIRVSSIEALEITDEIIDLIGNNSKIVDHMHIPLQSGCDETLSRMNRRYNTDKFLSVIDKIRAYRPDYSVTTDVIVGFPGESEVEFNKTVEFIKKVRFSKLHVFPYSKRAGTPAESMGNQIDPRVKKERVKILMDLSKELEIEYMNKFIGREITFIPEVLKDGHLIGHTGNFLSVKAKGDKLVHDEIKVEIISIDYPHVIAKIK